MKAVNNLFEIKPAHRVEQVSEYYFSTKLKEIAALNATGKDIISLGIGSPDLPPAPAVIDELCNDAAQSNAHGYQPYVGIPALRKAFADWYKKWYGVTLNANTEIQPLMGSKEGILHISLAFLNAGDGVLVPNPGYPTYSSVSKLAEARIIPYNLDAKNNWMPNFKEIEKEDLKGVKLMWVNYPNMPTGTAATPALFEELVAFGHRHGIIIVNDNPYSFILNDKPISILSVKGSKDICIEMNSLSKSHNMPGWRIGMIAANPQFITWILRVKSNIDSGMFRPLQKAASMALSLNADWYREINNVYRLRRIIAEEILTTLDCSYSPTQVGLFLWGKVPTATTGEKVADEVLYNANVFITPGFIFGSNGTDYIRISLCANEEMLNKALCRIKEMKNKINK